MSAEILCLIGFEVAAVLFSVGAGICQADHEFYVQYFRPRDSKSCSDTVACLIVVGIALPIPLIVTAQWAFEGVLQSRIDGHEWSSLFFAVLVAASPLLFCTAAYTISAFVTKFNMRREYGFK